MTPGQVLEHWTARLVRDLQREPIMDPLACMLARIGGYGLPLPQSRRRPAAREEPPSGPVATPQEVIAILKGSGLLAKTMRRACPLPFAGLDRIDELRAKVRELEGRLSVAEDALGTVKDGSASAAQLRRSGGVNGNGRAE